MEKVILVTVKLSGKDADWSLEERADELRLLAKTARASVVAEIRCQRQNPTPNLYIGKGKAEELVALIEEHNAASVIFNNDLTPTQQRNLEKALDVKVLDRTQLILDIFASHARSQEGKVQVELAQLEYLLPRLMGKGTELSRLGGGIGTSGPGEQKLEMDRRRIRTRIGRLKDQISSMEQRRAALRSKRIEHSLPMVTLVGYTNAGKSTLLHALTAAETIIRDEMFSTLDAITRRCTLPGSKQQILISDTVGFLDKLPHNLIEAFKATLEVAQEAELLLIVLDISHPKVQQHNDAIWEVLTELGAQERPVLYVLNKIDRVADPAIIRRFERQFSPSCAISARYDKQFDGLLARIQERLGDLTMTVKVLFPHEKTYLTKMVYDHGKVTLRDDRPEGTYLEAILPVMYAKKLLTEISRI